jgi:hypothetical protein
MIDFHSFNAFAIPSKQLIFIVDALRWAPAGFLNWVFERDQRPGMLRLRENRTYAREVAVKLVEEKRQELKDGASRKDLLSLLGSSCVYSVEWACENVFGSSVKANLALRPDWRLNDEEIIAQFR